MKKPRKPKAKRTGSPRAAGRSGAPRLAKLQASVREPQEHGRLRSSGPATAGAISIAWSDEREKLALLLLPFFIMAFALAFSQTIKHAPRLGEIAATAPLPGAALPASRPAPPPVVTDPLAAAPALRLPASAPVVPALPRVEDQLARTAMLQLPARAPSIALPEVRPTNPLRLPASAPAVDLPGLTLAAPHMRLPAEPPAVAAPASSPAVVAALAPVPVLTPQRYPPPLGRPSATTRPDLCVATPDLGRHVYPAVAHTSGEPSTAEAFGELVSAAAIAQTASFVIYSDKYRRMSYPMGDVQTLFGVCTDVVIRAYRSAGVDLQEQVQRAHIGAGDRSIGHRRTLTLQKFFAARGIRLAASSFAEDYLPGDIVTYERPQNSGSRNHIAIVTDRIAPSGRPMIVHNRGWGPQLEDALFVDRITGHYRYRPAGIGPTQEARQPAVKRAEARQRQAARAKHRTERDHAAAVVRTSLTGATPLSIRAR